ncbi:MAG: DUF2752 domain-containing protein [Muribaculaceae bacterium]|nr:DUF2752 domain-containing protein [Muribaculaceae bacterium]
MGISARWRAVIAVVVLGTAGLLYYLYDPARSQLAPKCSFKLLTGWDCPGCGAQRMVHSLLHLDFASAWQANPFLLCMMPVLILLGFSALWRNRYPRMYATFNSPIAIAAVGVAIVLWTVLRNIF